MVAVMLHNRVRVRIPMGERGRWVATRWGSEAARAMGGGRRGGRTAVSMVRPRRDMWRLVSGVMCSGLCVRTVHYFAIYIYFNVQMNLEEELHSPLLSPFGTAEGQVVATRFKQLSGPTPADNPTRQKPRYGTVYINTALDTL
jgi:hypothetical protein